MPFPASDLAIEAEEAAIGFPLPTGLRQRLSRQNGGTIFAGGEEWTLFPVWDSTNRRTAAVSSRHIARETAALYEGMATAIPPNRAAIGSNEGGDYLLLDSAGRISVWRHETGAEELTHLDDAARAMRRPRSESDPAARIAVVLGRLTSGHASAVIVDAHGSGIYLQFARDRDTIVGEAVGERNLSKLQAYRIGPRLARMLPDLGWGPPRSGHQHAGNWSRSWQLDEWAAAEGAKVSAVPTSPADDRSCRRRPAVPRRAIRRGLARESLRPTPRCLGAN